jgi:hypothetical protein
LEGEDVKTSIGLDLGVCLLEAPLLRAAGDDYRGGIAALATLSADGRSVVSQTTSQISSYKPENGPALNLFVGRYLGNYVSVQGNFIWNANDLSFVSNTILPEGASFYSEMRSSSQTSVVGDVLVFFRRRGSLLRPYLSTGVGIIHLQSSQQKLASVSGSPPLPAHDFSSYTPGLRVAVGIDVRIRRGFWLGYSFSETISSNPLSDQLSPSGQRDLKNFQNLWGFLKTF